MRRELLVCDGCGVEKRATDDWMGVNIQGRNPLDARFLTVQMDVCPECAAKLTLIQLWADKGKP